MEVERKGSRIASISCRSRHRSQTPMAMRARRFLRMGRVLNERIGLGFPTKIQRPKAWHVAVATLFSFPQGLDSVKKKTGETTDHKVQ